MSTKISQLPAAIASVAADIYAVVQGGVTRQIAGSAFADWVLKTYAGFTQSGTGAVSESVQTTLRRTVYAAQFGVTANGTTDDTAAMQLAINYAISSLSKLILPAGVIKITSPLYIWVNNGVSAFVNFSMEGAVNPVRNDAVSPTIIDHSSYVNLPGIIIQGARGVTLKWIRTKGPNNFLTAIENLYNVLLTESTYTVGSCRDSRYSPQCGIAIDPFCNGVPADGGYPGLSAYYVANVQNSSRVNLEACSVISNIVGICGLGIGGSNTELVNIHNCELQSNRSHIALGHTQQKSWSLTGSNFLYGSLFVFNGRSYGDQTGHMPEINPGTNIGGSKFIFNIYMGSWKAAVSGLFAEAILSLGYIGDALASGTHSLDISGSYFSFFRPTTSKAVDFHGYFFAPVNFNGCSLISSDQTNALPLRFIKDARATVTLTETKIGCTQNGEIQLAFSTGAVVAPQVMANLHIDQCMVIDGLSGTNASVFSHRNFVRTLGDVAACPLPPGALIHSCNNPTQLYFTSAAVRAVALGSKAITVSGLTATFTATDPTIVRLGDVVYAEGTSYRQYDATVSGSVQNAIGTVTTINGTTITVTGIPENVASATYTLSIIYWPRGVPAAQTGNTNTSTSLTSVTNPTFWKVGTRIRGTGIVDGTYITVNDGSGTMTISTAATATAAGIRLYDADEYFVTGTAL